MESQLLYTLNSISSSLDKPFWEDYSFWLGLLNLSILFITLLYLKRYTEETAQTRKQIARQTELEQMPIMLIFIKNIADGGVPYGELQKLRDKFRDFLIRIRTENDDSDFFIRLRNTGKGTAFNVSVESNEFDIIDYEAHFFAPNKDEHSIKIIQKDNKKIESWETFNDSIFIIKCDDLAGNKYEFKYKILDFRGRKIQYIN